MSPFQTEQRIGIVVIGRNEGERLKRCISSLPADAAIAYVDSGSTDGSVEWARSRGLEIVIMDSTLPFTAARARNAGFRRLKAIAQDMGYVQFIDGDCELMDEWIQQAAAFLDCRKDASVVTGRLRERHPERSIYNWLCDREWDEPPGEVRACGGIAMMRVSALAALGGFRDDLIAGEEPELCVRFRLGGWRIWRLDTEMALHDAGMTQFGQWWRRMKRGGYAFAQGANLHGRSSERHWVWETQRAWLWGLWIPLACFVCGFILWPWGWLTLLIFPLHVVQKTFRLPGTLRERFALAFFHVLTHFAQCLGQARFLLDRLRGSRSGIMEYK